MKQKFEQIPTTDVANYLIFSMHSLEGIQAYLDNFHDGKSILENKACSATLIWSGEEGSNIRVSTYSDKNGAL